MEEKRKKEMTKQLVTKLANDIWAVAKTLEEEGIFEQANNLKTISSCLHDVRTDSNIDWYLNRDIENDI